MNRNMLHSQIIFLCFFLLVLVGCHNNAHLRTQKVLKPGEKAYSGSGVLAVGSETRYGRLDYTGIPGMRGDVSMLTGRKGGEAGPYLSFIIGGALGLSLPLLFASTTVLVPYYPAEIKTQNGKQVYKNAYVKEARLLRTRSTVVGTSVGSLGFGVFMLMLISSF